MITAFGADARDLWVQPAEERAPTPWLTNRLPGDSMARLRINLTYLWRHGSLPNLDDPQTFTELVQLRKLYDCDVRLPRLADKVLVKRHVADRLGPEWIIPTLWHGRTPPRAPSWPTPFVLKSRHGCKQCIFVRSGLEDWNAAIRKSQAWLRRPYGEWLDERLYRSIERGLLVEPFVGTDGVLPVDFKLYVFAGRVEFIQVHLKREKGHRWIIFDKHWRRVSTPSLDNPPPPASLPAMIEAAEELARDIHFTRIDFYEIQGRPKFGEMTFYPGSGLDPFDPVALDAVMGRMWLRALSTPPPFGARIRLKAAADLEVEHQPEIA